VNFVSRESSSANKPQLVVTSELAGAGPQTTIDSGPSGTTASSSATFGFSSTDPGASFECRLDGGGWEACGSPRAYAGLGEGQHSFQVRAVDAAGTADPTPAVRDWTVDTTPPTPPAGLTADPGDREVALDWTANSEPDLATYAVYRRAADGSWPATPIASRTSSSFTDTGLTNGTSYTYRVSAVDGAGNESSPSTTATATPEPPSAGNPVVAVSGDVACSPTHGAFNNGLGTATACRQKYTSDIIVGDPSYTDVIVSGDMQYEDGKRSDYDLSYHPSWGRFKSKTHPAIGNHESTEEGLTGYCDYFGAAAHCVNGSARNAAYYSYDLGAWHIIHLNSNCAPSPPTISCSSTSPQLQWLRQDLAENTNQCVAAVWHHPRFSSSSHGNYTAVTQFWNELYDADADLVLSGHDHGYERFQPLNRSGAVDTANGMTSFVAGLGGRGLYSFGSAKPGSAVRYNGGFGILRLVLKSGSFDWRFVSEAGKTFTDSGSKACH